MTLNLRMPEKHDLRPRITVFGVGGAGGNAVNNMIDKNLEGVEFVTANTDAQALAQSRSANKVQLGVKVTEGLGAGARPSVGSAAAEETIEEIVDHLAGAHMCFITAGMGGGTGTGAAPIIAQAARELGVLTVGVVTKPFQFEGAKRMRQAEEGVEALQKVVDTLIIIPNQNLFRLANEKTTFTEAFSMADDVLYQGVKGVTDLMVRPGLINLDFADVRAVMDEMGKAMMGTGEAEGEDRAVKAAEKAIANPLLDEISLDGARGVLINITGAYDLTLFELDEAANRIREEVDPDANIIVGSTLDPEMEGRMRVSVVATGIDAAQIRTETPLPRRRLAEPLGFDTGEDVAQEDNTAADAAWNAAADDDDMAGNEPSLFGETAHDADEYDEPDGHLFAETGYDEDAYGEGAEAELDEDGLPLPSYRPEAAEPALEQHHFDDDEEDDAFVAPKRPATGAASPEGMSRIRAAAAQARAEPQRRQPPQPVAEEPAPAGERKRFGINSLIHRMSGHGAEPPRKPDAAAATAGPASRRQPPLRGQTQEDDGFDPEQDRIEIPAFLRRQAN